MAKTKPENTLLSIVVKIYLSPQTRTHTDRMTDVLMQPIAAHTSTRLPASHCNQRHGVLCYERSPSLWTQHTHAHATQIMPLTRPATPSHTIMWTMPKGLAVRARIPPSPARTARRPPAPRCPRGRPAARSARPPQRSSPPSAPAPLAPRRAAAGRGHRARGAPVRPRTWWTTPKVN